MDPIIAQLIERKRLALRDRVRQKLESEGWSLGVAAKRTGFSKSYIQKVWNGDVVASDRLLDALGLSHFQMADEIILK